MFTIDQFNLKNSQQNFFEVLLNNLSESIHLLSSDLQVLYVNPASETLSGYPASEIIGKTCPKNLLLQLEEYKPVPCEDACPVAKTLKTGEIQSFRAYIHHRDGHMLPVNMRLLPMRNKSGDITGVMEIFSDISPKMTMPENQYELERMDLLDELTGLGNQRFLRMHLRSRIEEMADYKLTFGILFIDVDNIGKINDTYGIPAGDKLLKMIARTIKKNIRFYEVIGRWGDDKFICVLLNMDDSKLDLVANKLRLLLEQGSVRELDLILRTTVSIGATSARIGDTVDSLVERAVDLTSYSKRLGKNRVSFRLSDDEDF